jgi:hypothetical protein
LVQHPVAAHQLEGLLIKVFVPFLRSPPKEEDPLNIVGVAVLTTGLVF